MIIFLSISTFRSRLRHLLGYKRGVYAGVEREITEAFGTATIDEIRNNRDMILIDDPVVWSSCVYPIIRINVQRKMDID